MRFCKCYLPVSIQKNQHQHWLDKKHLVVAEDFSELEPGVLPVVEPLVLNDDAVKVLVEAGRLVALQIKIIQFCPV